MLLFATEKQVKRVFRAFIPKSVKEFRKRENLHTFFSCTFGAKSTKSLRTSFSAGACEPRHCTGRARSGLCATPWQARRSPHPLFPRQTRVRIGGAANGGIVYFTWQCASEARSSLLFLPASGCVSLLFRKTNHPRNSIFLFPQGDSRLGSDGERADGGLKARAAGTVCLQTRAVARRRFQPFGRRHRNRSGGFCCFSPPKSREREKSFFLVLLGPKVPKASARRFPRERAIRGAARGAQDLAYAPPRGRRAAARTLFFRVKRECGLIVPPTAALIIYIWQCAPAFFLPARRFPTWFRWRKSGRRLKARAAGTVCLQTRE